MTHFKSKVLAIVKSIPRGQTLSYADVARMAGHPKAYRAVASLMKKNYDPEVPCHRVIKSNGELGDYNRGGIKVKKKLLEAERTSKK